jgi:hypothetical protein
MRLPYSRQPRDFVIRNLDDGLKRHGTSTGMAPRRHPAPRGGAPRGAYRAGTACGGALARLAWLDAGAARDRAGIKEPRGGSHHQHRPWRGGTARRGHRAARGVERARHDASGRRRRGRRFCGRHRSRWPISPIRQGNGPYGGQKRQGGAPERLPCAWTHGARGLRAGGWSASRMPVRYLPRKRARTSTTTCRGPQHAAKLSSALVHVNIRVSLVEHAGGRDAEHCRSERRFGTHARRA